MPPSFAIASPTGRLVIVLASGAPASSSTPAMQRYQVFTHFGAGTTAQLQADALLRTLPQTPPAEQAARQLYQQRGLYNLSAHDLESQLRHDLTNGLFITAYYIPTPELVPEVPAQTTQTTGLLADPPGAPAQWSVTQRIAAMLRRIPTYVPGALHNAVAALFTPQAIAALAIFLAVLAIAQFYGVGELVDAFLAAVAWRYAGLAGLYALGKFIGEIINAARATSIPAINQAAQNAATNLVALGIDFLTAILIRAAAEQKMASAKPTSQTPPPENSSPPNPIPPVKRPSWQTSETDVGQDLGPDIRPQISYLNGKEVPLYTPGSVRPDFVTPDGSASFEVKNYNVATNTNGLIRSVSQQAIQRDANLPTGMTQNIIIDIRGQVVSDAQKNNIISGIVSGSKNIIDPNAIDFKE